MPSDEYIRDLENNRIFHSYGYDEGYKDGYKKGYEDGKKDKEADDEQQGTGRSC